MKKADIQTDKTYANEAGDKQRTVFMVYQSGDKELVRFGDDDGHPAEILLDSFAAWADREVRHEA